MRGEIAGGTWQFKDATRISRILSPKEHIPGKTYDDLTGYTCVVDYPKFRAAYATAAQKLESQPWAWKAYAKERDSYDDIVNLLNRCVAAGTKALHDHDNDLEGTWYQNLTFVKYDKAMGDGIGDAAALQPDLGGVDDKSPAPKLYWSPPDGVKKSRMSIPVEVKGEWRELIAQAATYGRCLFSANPSRVFALVLGVNHRRKSLRFLLFHRGGLTTHTEIFFETTHGRAEVLRVLMTVLSWSDAHHAGFVSTSNELRYMLPVSADLHMKATVAKVIHHSDCVRGRATRVTRLTCDSLDAKVNSEAMVLSRNLEPSTTPQAHVRRSSRLNAATAQSPPPSLPGSQPKDSRGSRGSRTKDSEPKQDRESEPIYPHHTTYDLKWSAPSNFTPVQGSLINGHDVVLKASWQGDRRKDVERQMFQAANGAFGTPAVFCSYEGTHPDGSPVSNRLLLPTLKEVQDDLQLYFPLFVKTSNKLPNPDVRTLCFTIFRTLGKSLTEAGSSDELCIALVHALLGWLSYYQSGHMQRDVSIGNVLLTVGGARSKEPFAISEDVLKQQRPHSSLDEALGGMEIEDAEPEAARIASEIMALAGELDIKDQFTAFVTDGDMAANWTTYFEEERNEMKCGTPEFMSLELHATMDDDEQLYVHSPVDDIQSFFWLAMWAVLFNSKSQTRSPLELEWQQSIRSGTHSAKASIAAMLVTTNFLRGHSLIGTQVFPLLREWWRAQRTLAEDWHELVVPEAESISTDQVKYRDFYLHHFHVYALRGVKEFLALVVQHREKLRAYSDFQ
ncbi:hypothetical protein C8R47DRAFT_684167 [Mycena vitilis]|nr:hypothetical protein C8R47DRAFT_684167 [Mycena vitilis]